MKKKPGRSPQTLTLLTPHRIAGMRIVVAQLNKNLDAAEGLLEATGSSGLWVRSSEQRLDEFAVIAKAIGKNVLDSYTATVENRPFTQTSYSTRSVQSKTEPSPPSEPKRIEHKKAAAKKRPPK